MLKRIGSSYLLTLLLVSLLAITSNIQVAEATNTIYIMADGSIDPPTAPISTNDNITYTLTDNISNSIVIQRDNIMIDGAAYTLQGNGSGRGFDLSNIDNVTIQDTTIRNFSTGIYLRESSHNTIAGNTLTNNSEGIRLIWDCTNNTIQRNTIAQGYGGIGTMYASYNTIADNLIAENEGRAIHLDDQSNNNYLLRNNITDNGTGVYLDHASANNIFRNNSIAGNYYNIGVHIYALEAIIQDIDPSNTVDGKPIYYLVNRRDERVPSDAGYVALVNCTNMTVEGLELRNNLEGLLLAGTQNSTIRNNTVTSNWYDVKIVYSSNNLLYHNNFINNAYPYFFGESTNTWDDGYPSGGNFWSHYSGTDLFKGLYQNETGSDGIGDSPCMHAHKDNYPLMKSYPWASHDIGVTAVITSKTIVGQGYSLRINMTVFNYGIFTENFNLTAYANMTIIGMFVNVTLTSRSSTTLDFMWNITSFLKGNCTIKAVISTVPNETDTSDNILVDGWIFVTIPGDVDGDRDIDIFDIVNMVDFYGTEFLPPITWPIPPQDVDSDGDVDIFDIVIAAGNYGESW